MNPLVSIITPCYNGEKYLSNYLKSVVEQTYDNIELIFVDDGSTDSSKDIFDSFSNQFSEKGYSVIYIYQENKGQAAAVNAGLRVFKGDYLIWTDADDILFPDNVARKVDYLRNNPDCGLVQSKAVVVPSEDTECVISELGRIPPRQNDNLFFDLLNETNVVFVPGIYMTTRKAFEKSIPSSQIFESREGQNWQLLLPISFNYRCGYIDEPLLKVVSHEDSHSRVERTLKEQISRFDGFVELLNATLKSMSINEKEKKQYIDFVKIKYAKKSISLIGSAERKERFTCFKSFITKLFFLISRLSVGKTELKSIIKYFLKR